MSRKLDIFLSEFKVKNKAIKVLAALMWENLRYSPDGSIQK